MDIGTLIMKVQADASNFNKGMSKVKGTVGNIAKTMTVAGAAVGVAFVAMGAKAVKFADDFKSASNSMAAATGATTEEIKEMEEGMKAIYANNFGESFEDIATAMSKVKQETNLAGKELTEATQNAIMMRDVFEFDVNESIVAADALIKNFGIDAKRAYEIIATGAQTGANQNGDMLDVLNEYSVHFSKLGFSAESFMETLADGGAEGVFQIDKIGDAVKEFAIRSKDMSTSSEEAFESLGLNANDMFANFAEGGDYAQTAFKDVMEALQDIDDPLEKNAIGVKLFGTQFEDLEDGVVDILANLDGKLGDSSKTIDDVAGSLDKINEIKYNSFGNAMTGIKRQLEVGILLPVGDMILPILNKFANFIQSNMPKILESANNAFEGMKGTANVLYQFYLENLLPIFEEMGAWWDENAGTVKDIASDTFSVILGAAKWAYGFFKEYLLPIFIAIADFIVDNYPIIKETFIAVFDTIMSVVTPVWQLFENYLLPIIKAIFSFISDNFGTISSIVTEVFEAMVAPIQNAITVIDAFLSIIKRAVEAVTSYNQTELKNKSATVSISGYNVGLGSSGSNISGQRANGGQVMAGKSYLVNEGSGSEIFTPSTNGYVSPNGSGVTVNVTGNTIMNDAMVEKVANTMVRKLKLAGVR